MDQPVPAARPGSEAVLLLCLAAFLMAALNESVAKVREVRGEPAGGHELPKKKTARKVPAKKTAAKKTTSRRPRSA
ncbi:hypothetical protein [Streptomyces griseosporeus]|uniref:hypothetical protein n=1 Tax=Streptomyces griseosporeus TaxID=1910 RepID=UPI00167D15F5|nr:hypothetical protein [Streptomyces griseosporeus]GHF50290.1 hypothetical protein GCM10018783_18590 [Streptomyces griseosporeus]